MFEKTNHHLSLTPFERAETISCDKTSALVSIETKICVFLLQVYFPCAELNDESYVSILWMFFRHKVKFMGLGTSCLLSIESMSHGGFTILLKFCWLNWGCLRKRFCQLAARFNWAAFIWSINIVHWQSIFLIYIVFGDKIAPVHRFARCLCWPQIPASISGGRRSTCFTWYMVSFTSVAIRTLNLAPFNIWETRENMFNINYFIVVSHSARKGGDNFLQSRLDGMFLKVTICLCAGLLSSCWSERMWICRSSSKRCMFTQHEVPSKAAILIVTFEWILIPR